MPGSRGDHCARSCAPPAPTPAHYFGGREALAEAVLTRILVPLNTLRLELLERAEASGEPTLTDLVEALVRPDIETAHVLVGRSPGRARLIGAIYLRPADFVEATLAPTSVVSPRRSVPIWRRRSRTCRFRPSRGGCGARICPQQHYRTRQLPPSAATRRRQGAVPLRAASLACVRSAAISARSL